MVDADKLKNELLGWDGKSADAIAGIYGTWNNLEGFEAALVELSGDELVQVGATWMLKRYLESGCCLVDGDVDQVYARASGITKWEAQLHLLQSMGWMPVPESRQREVEVFVRACLKSRRTFVRAWAHSGFYELAVRFPIYQDEVTELFKRAQRDEAASVKARVRQVFKNGF